MALATAVTPALSQTITMPEKEAAVMVTLQQQQTAEEVCDAIISEAVVHLHLVPRSSQPRIQSLPRKQ